MSGETTDDEVLGVQLIGRVVHTKDVRLYFDGKELRGHSGFSAPKGHLFAVLVIACEEMGKQGRGPIAPTSIHDFLKAAGWTPPKKRKRARSKK